MSVEGGVELLTSHKLVITGDKKGAVVFLDVVGRCNTMSLTVSVVIRWYEMAKRVNWFRLPLPLYKALIAQIIELY